LDVDTVVLSFFASVSDKLAVLVLSRLV